MTNVMRRERLTALCGKCGETCKEYSAAVRGNGWNCLWCGYLSQDEMEGIAQRENPKYSDGSPVLWLPETPLLRPMRARDWALNGLTSGVDQRRPSRWRVRGS